MIYSIKENAKIERVELVVTRTFGTQNLLELYTDYVSKRIRDTLIIEKEGKNKEKT